MKAKTPRARMPGSQGERGLMVGIDSINLYSHKVKKNPELIKQELIIMGMEDK
jgi:hypothetical protein